MAADLMSLWLDAMPWGGGTPEMMLKNPDDLIRGYDESFRCSIKKLLITV